MPTETVKFTAQAMRRALDEADSRHTPAQPLIQRDPAFTGLTLRTQGRSAAWYLKAGKTLKKLGDVGNPRTPEEARSPGVVYTVDDARRLADQARRLIEEGTDPSDYLKARQRGASHEDALGKAASILAAADRAWTWEELVSRFINDRIAKPTITSRGKVRHPSRLTLREVRGTLTHPDLDHLKPLLLRDIRREHIERVRDDWNARGRAGAQRKLCAYTKSAFTWARSHYANAGLTHVPPWWHDIRSVRYATKAQLAEAEGNAVAGPLSPRQVAVLLFTAERYRVAPGREIAARTSETALAALWWLALTAQRVHAAYSVETARVYDATAESGWYEVVFLPREMKSRRWHALPIPREVYRRTIARALADPRRRSDSKYVFASPKLRTDDDRPVADAVVNSLLNRLRGKDTSKASGVDLLKASGLPHFTLHELRDALATFLSADPKIPASAASAILDHASDSGLEPTSRESAVTREHYNKSHRMQLKFLGLTAWANAVLREYEALLEQERRRLGLSSGLGNTVAVRQNLAQLKPEDAWLLDRHLPVLPGDEAAARRGRGLDLRALRRD